MEFESCILSEIDRALTDEMKKEMEDILKQEISKSEKTFGCILRDIECSESLGELTYNFRKFSEIYFLTLEKITNILWLRINFKGLLTQKRISNIDLCTIFSQNLKNTLFQY